MKKYKEKICVRCNNWYLPTSARQKFCHSCIPEARKEHYRENVKRWRSRMSKEELKEYRRNEYLRNNDSYKTSRDKYFHINRYGRSRDEILSLFNYKCADCGSANMLHIHHLDKQGRNTDNPNNELRNLRVVCASCHTKYHTEGQFKVGHKPFNKK